MLSLLVGNNSYTYAAVMLSLVTNVTATLLIAYKAWWVLIARIVYSKANCDLGSTGNTGSWSKRTSMSLGLNLAS